jgi:hypothetical protein
VIYRLGARLGGVMSVHDLKEYKRKRRRKAALREISWKKSIYHPKTFRWKSKFNTSQSVNDESVEHKVMPRIVVMVVVIVFMLVYAALKKYGLID